MKLLILDLDGTVRIKKGGVIGEFESGFIDSPEDQEIIPGAMSAIKKYHSEGLEELKRKHLAKALLNSYSVNSKYNDK